MSFGVYRPQMGVASGMRVLCSDQTLQEQRRAAECNGHQQAPVVNPITGEMAGGVPEPKTATRRPPSGNLQPGLQPLTGPMDPLTVPNKDVFGKKVDPTRNQSANFGGAEGFCIPKSDDISVRSGSRITQGNLELGEGGLGAREPTPERRSVPGQVLRGGLRPKDHLSGSACVTSDRQDHPLALPRKAGSAGPGTGSGGSVHIIAGPTGFVPAGEGYEVDFEVAAPLAQKAGSSGYKPVWG
mmetsp:Transcript_64559/g.151280  ORF Transcript_64559/g.151280 Transcript_64559/m.151280 type:complete len:241 (+) Transcript_64559:79-801(+)